jgi:hypothetical protein
MALAVFPCAAPVLGKAREISNMLCMQKGDIMDHFQVESGTPTPGKGRRQPQDVKLQSCQMYQANLLVAGSGAIHCFTSNIHRKAGAHVNWSSQHPENHLVCGEEQ